MSSHCGRYPACKCPKVVGMYCHTGYTIEEIIGLNSNDLVEKSDGNGVCFPVDNPVKFTYSDFGHRRKIRHKKPTNITPKKKKRK